MEHSSLVAAGIIRCVCGASNRVLSYVSWQDTRDASSSVTFSPGGKHLASGSRDNTARLWDVATGAMVRTLTGPKGGVTSVAFSPDGKALASGSEDNSVWLWDVQSETVLRTLANMHGDARHRILAQR